MEHIQMMSFGYVERKEAYESRRSKFRGNNRKADGADRTGA